MIITQGEEFQIRPSIQIPAQVNCSKQKEEATNSGFAKYLGFSYEIQSSSVAMQWSSMAAVDGGFFFTNPIFLKMALNDEFSTCWINCPWYKIANQVVIVKKTRTKKAKSALNNSQEIIKKQDWKLNL